MKGKEGKRRIGRPIKAAKKGQRSMLGVFVGPDIRAKVAAAAKVSGRTLSREVEILIERAVAYDAFMASMKTTLEGLQGGQVEAELRRLGYVAIRDPVSGKKLWAEPGYPGIQQSGFMAVEPGELEARQAAGLDEETERHNAEAIRRANLGPVQDVRAAREWLDRIAEEPGGQEAAAPKKDEDAA